MESRTLGIARLLELKHELDLQALAAAQVRAHAVWVKISSLKAQMDAGASADQPSSLAGNDAIWAQRAAVTLTALRVDYDAAEAEHQQCRKAARRSFGRIEAFDGLVAAQRKADKSSRSLDT
jgi:hypothetical protein